MFAQCPLDTVSVNIEALDGVGKGQTRDIQVTLTPSSISGQVVLNISTATGTGSAKFADNNATLKISESQTVSVEGVTESSTVDNIRMTAKASGQTDVTEVFSVVHVTLSIRNGSSSNISSDNAGGTRWATTLGTTRLGTFFNSGGSGAHLWRTGVEIVGSVKPTNYTGLITLKREVVASVSYSNMTQINSVGPFDDTTADASLRDDDPQSGGSAGKVYDLDAPGIGLTSSAPVGAILRRRTNFRQWAVLSGTENRVSNDIEWFSRLSVIKTATGFDRETSVSNDNVSGTGATNLSWNLQ